MNRAILLAGMLTGMLLAGPAGAQDDRPKYAKRWVYAAFNLQVKASADQLIELIGRAGRAGYNGVVLADFKLNILGLVPDSYFANVARVRRAAQADGVELIPVVCPFGYSEGLLAHDPNLAEGVPVREAPAVIRDGRAALVPGVQLRNGGLEETGGNGFAGFSVDDFGKASFADREVVHGGKVSCRMQDMGRHNPAGNCRLIQGVAVRPFACYRLSCWVKTRGLSSPESFRLLALGADQDPRPLTHYAGAPEPTQEWRKVEIVFNSLNNQKVNVYAGVWAGGTGTLWVDDVRLEELFLVNVLRREGCPLRVTSADGATAYEEGRDFEPVRDEKLGQAGSRGEYGFGHESAALRLTRGSRIREGQQIKVSYYHPLIIYGYAVPACMAEEKVYDLVRDQVRRVEQLLGPGRYFMAHDEIRVAGWCQACRDSGKTPGQLLAANVRRCAGIIHQINPRAEIVVWSDMFDPHHNAVDDYYLTKGTFKGSWEGLPRGVTIASWNGGKARKSLEWFAGRGHEQIIAGYYDGSDLDNFRHWDEAARGVRGVTGFMYTTWQKKYGLLEEYGKALRRGE